MKRLVALLALILLATTATAHTDHSSEALPEATHKPGSVMFGMEQAMESIDLALTFDREKKVKKQLKHAEERLAEANQLAKQNKSDRAEKAIKIYSRQMEDINRSLQELPKDRREELHQDVKESVEVQSAVLEDILHKTPKAANEGLKNALENSPAQPGHRNKPEDSSGEAAENEEQEEQSSGYSVTGRAIPMDER